MLFMMVGYLKEGAEDQLINYHDEFNEHVGQSGTNIVIAGALQNPDGSRVGYLALFDGSSIEDAKAWLNEGPFYKASLYQRVDIFEYHNEIGHVG